MAKRSVHPVVRHAYAEDPDPAKVQAALDLWCRALAKRVAEQGSEGVHHTRGAE